tara:strand:- start:4201 stop:9504 length:5304 start_codon:yes stop_codon:yes gene_type:complete
MRVEESYEIPEQLIEQMKALYEYESREVTHGLNIGRDFSVEWTEDDLVEIIIDAGCAKESAAQLLNELDGKKRLVKLFSKDGSVRAYRTDTAELVRLSTFNYNRYPEPISNKMVSTQSGVTWDIEAKMTPKWSISINKVSTMLQSEVRDGWVDDNGKSHTYENSKLNEAIPIVVAAYDRIQKKKFNMEGMLSGFQFRSVRAMLRGMYSTGDKTLAILAGTGSGKSYGFQIGSLIAIVEQRLAGTLNKTHSIFLYPRVALMDDQRKTMEELLEYCNRLLVGKEIRWVTDGGSNLKKDYQLKIEPGISDQGLNKIGAPKLIKAFYGSSSQCPHLVFANPDTITNRLTSFNALDGLTSELKNVVFDEIHLLESITGANTSGVIRRLCAHANRDLMLTGSSATIADERDHLSKVFARKENEVIVVKPEEEELELTGIIHHVFHKGIEGRSFKTNLVNLTSLVSHQRRRRKTDEISNPEKSHKTIGFADSLNLLGSWEFMLRDNEGLEFRPDVLRKIRKNEDVSELLPDAMPLPYRFDKPLIHISKINQDIDEEEAKEHCNSCISGKNSTMVIENSEILKNLPLDYFREGKLGVIDQLYEGEREIGVTDKCPYFECGACWREEADYTPIPLYKEGPVLYTNSMHPIRLTSQSISQKKNESGLGVELEHFSINLDEYHNLKNIIKGSEKFIPDNEQVAEIALSSPAIEVGMDFDNALDAVMFKAIRNVSAYRQKVGRLGRERFRDVYSSMLVSFRAVDYHYYRNPSQLLSNERLDPIPLNVDNENVRKQIAYMAVYDDIAKNGGKTARNLHNLRYWAHYKVVVDAALYYLDNNYDKIANRMKKGLKEQKLSICKEAIDKVKEHLSLLVHDISPLLQGDDKCLADRIGFRSMIERSTRNQDGMQNIHLTEEGGSFIGHAITLNDILRDIALNRHYDDEKSHEVTEAINLAVEIWDNFQKGIEDKRLRDFIDEHVNKEIVMALIQNPNPLANIFLNAHQQKLALEDGTVPAYAKSLIYEGKIPLAESLNQWKSEANKHRGQFSIHYLRDLFSALHFTKHDLPFVFQKTLFKPPNEKNVAVLIPKPGNSDSKYNEMIEDLPIREALFDCAPGMWSYRRAKMPMKSSCYQQLQPTGNSTHMNMPLNNINGEMIIKHKFIQRSKIQEKDIPWNFNLNLNTDNMNLYEPENIQLRFTRGLKNGNVVIKGKAFNDDYTLIKDDDDTHRENFTQNDERESEDEGEKSFDEINVPDCFPIGWRAVSSIRSNSFGSFNGPFKVEFEDDILRKMLFDNIEFAESAYAKEFILGNTRKYQGGGELEIQYVDNKISNKNAVIGHEYHTQGLRFVVSKSTLEMAANWTLEQISKKSGNHTTYQVLHYILSKNLGINRFVVDSLLRLTLERLNYAIPNNLELWFKEISNLMLADFTEFKDVWEGTTMKGISLDVLQYTVQTIEADPEIIARNYKKLAKDWAVKTYSNSFAIHILQAAREFTGSRDEDLGYHVECDAGILDSDSEIVIWLYDRSPDGNGSCDTLKKWMQIPKIVKDEFEKSKERTLPSQDYIDCLEGTYLVPCSAHQSDIIAYACYQNKKDPKEIRHGLSREFRFSYDNYKHYWKKLEEKGYYREDFPFVKLVIPLIFPDLSEQEFFNRAIEGCHSSCVECLEEFGISMFGPLDGPNFANKRMISQVLTTLMNQNPEDYRQTEVSISGAGTSLKGIATYDPNKPLHLEINGQTEERFTMLHPYRMWAEVDIENPFDKHGKIQSKFWTKMKIDRWSDGEN